MSIATFCDDIAAYIEKNLTPPIVIGGISMGAAIALRLAVKRPDLVKALIIAKVGLADGTRAGEYGAQCRSRAAFENSAAG